MGSAIVVGVGVQIADPLIGLGVAVFILKYHLGLVANGHGDAHGLGSGPAVANAEASALAPTGRERQERRGDALPAPQAHRSASRGRPDLGALGGGERQDGP